MWAIFQRVGMIVLLVAVVVTLHRQGEAKHALCTFRDDLNQRQTDGLKYLSDLDEGKRKPLPGISRADIVRSLNNQQRTLDSLSDLNCK